MSQGRHGPYLITSPQQVIMHPQQNTVSIHPTVHAGQPRQDFATQLQEMLQQDRHIFTTDELALPSIHSALPCISSKVDTSLRWPPLRPSLGNIWSDSSSINPCGIAGIPLPSLLCSNKTLKSIPKQDEDTLFLIWSLMSGTQAQEIAGAALEQLGWRYDTESATWYLEKSPKEHFYYETASMSRKQAEVSSFPQNLPKCRFNLPL